MNNIKKIIDSLLDDIADLEINYYKNAISYFERLQTLDGTSHMTEKVISIDENEEFDIPFHNISSDVEIYFFQLKKIIEKDTTKEDKIDELKRVDLYVSYYDEDFNKEEAEEAEQLLLEELQYEIDKIFDYNIIYQKNKILKNVLKLNDTLDEPSLQLKKLEALQYKKLINAEEFTLLYNKSKNTQLNYKKRINNPLPFLGGGKGKDLMYNKDEVDEWFKCCL